MVIKVELIGSDTFIALSNAITGTTDLNETVLFGGGPGSDTAAGGITVFGPTDGSVAPISFSGPTGLTTSYNISGVQEQGTVVNFTLGQSGQYTIGADTDTTATAFAAALNAVASDATAAVVAVTSGSDYVTPLRMQKEQPLKPRFPMPVPTLLQSLQQLLTALRRLLQLLTSSLASPLTLSV